MGRTGTIAAAGIIFGAGAAACWAAGPKNVIVFIGDGMGPEHVTAAGYYFNGQAGLFNFEQLPRSAWMSHNNSAGLLTESAASATAIATGFKVNNDVISTAFAAGPDPRSATPSDGRDLLTMLEVFKSAGKRTGLVTNSYLNDATPAAFGAHVPLRSFAGPIVSDYLTQTRPNVLFGGAAEGVGSATFASAGHAVVNDRASMLALDPATTAHAAGLFGPGQFPFAYDQSAGSITFYDANPRLHEMTGAALHLLGGDPNGFFLMVENELIDAAGHLAVDSPDKVARGIFEIRELSLAVQRAVDFADANPDTLILVAADHETGSLTADVNNGIGVLPGVTSGSTRHNATFVPVYARGPNAQRVYGHLDNTDLFHIATASDPAPPPPPLATRAFRGGVDGYAGVADTQVRADQPDSTHGSAAMLAADLDDDPGGVVSAQAPVQAAIRFDGLFDGDSLPAGATVVAARLSLYTGNGSGDGTAREIALHRLLVPFDEQTSWNSAGTVAGNGFSLNGAGSADDDYIAAAEGLFPAPSGNAVVTFDVTGSVAAWLDAWRQGADVNFGWVLFNTGTDGWAMHSTEALALHKRPLLEVVYAVPEPTAAAVTVAIGMAMLVRRRGRNAEG